MRLSAWLNFTIFLVVSASAHLYGQAEDSLLGDGTFENGLVPWKRSFGPAKAVERVVDTGAKGQNTHVRICCDGWVGGIDAPRLRIGDHLSPRAGYAIVCRLRNNGVSRGGFGLRLYWYDASGEFVKMQTAMTIDKSSAAHDWRECRLAFGRDTAYPMPAGAAELLVRFSLWGTDQDAAGSVGIDDIRLVETAAPAPLRSNIRALLWNGNGHGSDWGAPVLVVKGLLEDEGFTVELAENAPEIGKKLSLEEIDLAVFPEASMYPAGIEKALTGFLRQGGAMMILGSGRLSAPVFRTPEGWFRAGAAGSEVAKVITDAPWSLDHKDEVTQVACRRGSEPGVLDIDVNGLKSFAYIGSPFPDISDEEDLVLCFRARGDANTRLLCLELQEEDGSRWKAVVRLQEDWQDYAVHVAEFASYAGKERSSQKDCFHATHGTRFFVGFTGKMAGSGDHRFSIRNVRLCHAAVPCGSLLATTPFGDSELCPRKWFGDSVVSRMLPGPGQDSVAVADVEGDACEVRAASGANWAPIVPAPDHRVLRTDAPDSVTAGRRKKLADVLLQSRRAVVSPLILSGPVSKTSQPVAALFCHTAGGYVGGRWALFALDCSGLGSSPVLQREIRNAAGTITRGVFAADLRPVFSAAAGDWLALSAELCIQNPGIRSRNITVSVTVHDADGRSHLMPRKEIMLPPLRMAPIPVVVKGTIERPAAEWSSLALTAEISVDEAPDVPPLRFSMDLREALRDICDALLRTSVGGGKLSGTSFVDNRGVRALLGAYEIFEEEKYLRAALEWGDAMMREQRDDGGYRMGYGITSRGEECYVADGGEIAVAMAVLTTYAVGEQQKALIESLERYMAFREAFRVEEGGIGVGWCLTDYGKRPVKPHGLEKPTKIFAPEVNTYTIGCSLAAAYAHTALKEHAPELLSRVRADADWLMPRAKVLNGAFIESYLFAHCFDSLPGRQVIYGDYIRQVFLVDTVRAAGSRAWWLGGDGRSALNLDGLVYITHHLGGDTAVQSLMMNAAARMFSPDVPSSILSVVQEPPFNSGEWIYICYGTLALADLIQPMVTMDCLRGERR